MLTNKKMISVAIAGFVIATSAQASQPGAYVGAQLGWGNTHQSILKDAKNDLSAFTATHSSISDTGLAGRLFSGYQFTQNFAAELGVSKFSDATGKYAGTDSGEIFDETYNASFNGNVKINTFAVDLVGKAILPLQNGFSLYAKLGAAYLINTAQMSVTANTNVNEDGTTFSDTTQFSEKDYAARILPTFGLGASYDISQKVSADLSWSHIQKTGHSSLINNVDFVGLGLTYHLG